MHNYSVHQILIGVSTDYQTFRAVAQISFASQFSARIQVLIETVQQNALTLKTFYNHRRSMHIHNLSLMVEKVVIDAFHVKDHSIDVWIL
jgi:hypothetical protein